MHNLELQFTNSISYKSCVCNLYIHHTFLLTNLYCLLVDALHYSKHKQMRNLELQFTNSISYKFCVCNFYIRHTFLLTNLYCLLVDVLHYSKHNLL